MADNCSILVYIHEWLNNLCLAKSQFYIYDVIHKHVIWGLIEALWLHISDVIMGATVSLITSLTSVYSTMHSGTDQRKHQSSASLAFVQGIHRRPVNSLHKWPVMRKMFPSDDVIMWCQKSLWNNNPTWINVESSSMRWFGIHPKPISMEILKISLNRVEKYTFKLQPHLPGANELTN